MRSFVTTPRPVALAASCSTVTRRTGVGAGRADNGVGSVECSRTVGVSTNEALREIPNPALALGGPPGDQVGEPGAVPPFDGLREFVEVGFK